MTKPPTGPTMGKTDSTLAMSGLKEVLFEFRQVGSIFRVTAIDPRTGIEVIMVADPRYGEDAIKRLATRKLAYVISKKRGGLPSKNPRGELI